MEIGIIRKQPEGYKAFIPNKFPPKAGFDFSPALIRKHSAAAHLVGKLDGITLLLPDVDFFLFMYIRKDAASSSQIEGTQATMVDAIEAESGGGVGLPADVDDIQHYVRALNYGLLRLREFPLSLRFIREVHEHLMTAARKSQQCTPGRFRKSQNWIGGTSPQNARFVPPPSSELTRVLSDFEKFLHEKDAVLPLFKIGLMHAQFEAIHPFLDGNGRTGRLLITLCLWLEGLLERPVLFLSAYFKKHQRIYYEKLAGYHEGMVEEWLDFFLDGITETAERAIATSHRITALRQEDMEKLQSQGKTAAESGLLVLRRLFAMPVVKLSTIQSWTDFSRQGALNVIDRFVDLGILDQRDKAKTYGRSYIYRRYVDIFLED